MKKVQHILAVDIVTAKVSKWSQKKARLSSKAAPFMSIAKIA